MRLASASALGDAEVPVIQPFNLIDPRVDCALIGRVSLHLFSRRRLPFHDRTGELQMRPWGYHCPCRSQSIQVLFEKRRGQGHIRGIVGSILQANYVFCCIASGTSQQNGS